MRILSGLLVAVVLLGLVTSPAAAQDESWQNKWYWGAQSGVYFFSTPTQSNDIAIDVGGHWLITAERAGLHLALTQVMYPDNSTSLTPEGDAVNFSSGRRLQADIFVFPMDGALQIYVGGGFMINYISDAAPAETFATPQGLQAALQNIDDVSTKAFFTVTGGAQWRLGRWAMFGSYQFTPSERDFLISTTQHAITGESATR